MVGHSLLHLPSQWGTDDPAKYGGDYSNSEISAPKHGHAGSCTDQSREGGANTGDTKGKVNPMKYIEQNPENPDANLLPVRKKASGFFLYIIDHEKAVHVSTRGLNVLY